MTDISELRALAERVEQATDNLYELSKEVGEACGMPTRYEHPGSENPSHRLYCTSLDAAMTLAGSSDYTPGNLRDDHPFSILTAAMVNCPLDSFNDLPRYVTAASLRARATRETDNG